MDIREKISNYFKLSNEDKDEVLIHIIETYKSLNNTNHNGSMLIKDLIEMDIELFKADEEFELVQALTDIRKAITQIEKELRNGL